MVYVQVGAFSALCTHPRDGMTVPAYFYFVSTAQSAVHGLHYVDVWMQFSFRSMPLRHGIYLGVLPDFLANLRPPRVIPEELAPSVDLYPFLVLLAVDLQMYYFMQNDNGFVDCYYQSDRMPPQEFYHFEVRDVRDPTMWFIGDDYVPIGMRLMPDWH